MLSQLEFRVVEPVNDDLAKVTHEWLREAVFFIGASWYTNRKEFKTVQEVSEKLRLRWLFNHSVIKVAIEQKERPQYWLGTYSIGNCDPFTLECFQRHYTVSADDIKTVECVTKQYLPDIEIVECYFCTNRFLNVQVDGKWRCDDCTRDFPSESSNKSGFVYIFGSVSEGYYKIGYGDRPVSRLRAYERGKLPFSVEMIHTIPVDDKVMAEAELHRLFRENRSNGEWFKLSDEEVNKITNLKRYVAGHWIKV